MIVDTHVHVVAHDTDRYPLQPTGVGTGWFREAPVSVEEYVALMDEAGVDRAVLVQAVGPYGDDNRYVIDAVACAPGRLVSVGVVHGADDLRQLAASEGVAGVRLFGVPDAGRVGDKALWHAAAELGLPVVVTLLAPELGRLPPLLERFAEVPVALDHCGFVDVQHDAVALFDLAPFPNLHLKVSTHVLDQTGDAVDRLAPVFGVERLLWGSDFSQTHDRPYGALVDLGRRAGARLSPYEQAAFLGGNALRLWPALA